MQLLTKSNFSMCVWRGGGGWGGGILSPQFVSLPLQSVIRGGCKLLCSNGHLDRSRWGVGEDTDLDWARVCNLLFNGKLSFRERMYKVMSMWLIRKGVGPRIKRYRIQFPLLIK